VPVWLGQGYPTNLLDIASIEVKQYRWVVAGRSAERGLLTMESDEEYRCGTSTQPLPPCSSENSSRRAAGYFCDRYL
jgi:hypothetical protein